MHANRPLSEAELCGIEWHTQQLIDTCQRTLNDKQSVPRANRPDWLRNEIQYWKHAKSALEWSLNIARQRRRKDGNNGSGNIRGTS